MKDKLVVITAWATRGDFNPLLSLALVFKARGARVVFVSDEVYNNYNKLISILFYFILSYYNHFVNSEILFNFHLLKNK